MTARTIDHRTVTPRIVTALFAPFVVVLLAVGLSAASASAEEPRDRCDAAIATILGTEGDDILRGTNGDDVIVGLAGDDLIYGRGGDDLICAGEGDDRIFAGTGNDTIVGDAGRDKIRGGPGTDVLSGGDDVDFLKGGAGADTVSGDRGADRVRGGTGDDTVSGGGGADVLWGGPGDDSLLGGNGIDILSGGDGDDRCDGQAGSQTTLQGCNLGPDFIFVHEPGEVVYVGGEGPGVRAITFGFCDPHASTLRVNGPGGAAIELLSEIYIVGTRQHAMAMPPVAGTYWIDAMCSRAGVVQTLRTSFEHVVPADQ